MSKNKENKEKRNHLRRMKKQEILEAVKEVFQSAPKEIRNYKQVCKLIGIENEVQKLLVIELLGLLAEQDYISEVDRGRYRLHTLGTLAVGIFRRRNNGKNSFVPEDGGAPVFVAERNSQHAMDGDKVKVQVLAKRKGTTPEAVVIEILEQPERTFVGKLQVRKGWAFLITEDKTLANDIFIPKGKLNGGKNGDKAVVRIVEWSENAKNPVGEVEDILGEAGKNTTEMHAILAEFGLPYKYPAAVEKMAANIAEDLTPQDREGREDFRAVPTFTIDPEDAKDFDDALSVRRLPNGFWEVGVHIADVTHYVKPDTGIDREARERATSVYLVDRTIPMLPERLCNRICSLRPLEEKLCFSVIFELDGYAALRNHRICRTVIQSNRRFTYEEAQQVIETGQGDYHKEIRLLHALSKKLREKRFKNGAINFERYEVKFHLDENGRPTGVYFKESTEANQLIEEFMLLANKTVAEFVVRLEAETKTPRTFVYRTHEPPEAEKLENFALFVRRFGYRLKVEGKKGDASRNMNRLLDLVHGKPEENLIETLAVRAMQKARYSTENIGHYGLAMESYTHFTSPIRRYPDMLVHRLLERYLAGGRSISRPKYTELCKHCSEMEVLAAGAERASIKYKQVEYMSERLGQIYSGVISGVTEWGIYVSLNENKCEGLVPVRDLEDDFYDFDEKNYCLRGRRHGQVFRLGEAVRVQVAQANLERKQLDFLLVE